MATYKTKTQEEGQWQLVLDAVNKAHGQLKDNAKMNDVLNGLREAAGKAGRGTREYEFLRDTIVSLQKPENKGLEKDVLEQANLEARVRGRKKEPAHEPQQQANAFMPTQLNLDADLALQTERWIDRFDRLLDDKSEEAGLARKLAGKFINMLLDPTSPQAPEAFRREKESFETQMNQDRKGIYEKAYAKFKGTYDGISLEQAKMIADRLGAVQVDLIAVDQTAPWIKFDEVKKAIDAGSSSGLTGYSLLYYEARQRLMDTNSRKKENQLYSDNSLYKLVSAAYAGGGLVEINEKIMSDAKFLKERAEMENSTDMKAGAVLAMNMRAQYDFFMTTKPEMIKMNRWNVDGLLRITNMITKLDPYIGFSVTDMGSIVSQTGTKAFTIAGFLKDFEEGRMNATSLSIVVTSGPMAGKQYTITGPVTVNGNKITVGSLVINALDGNCQLGSDRFNIKDAQIKYNLPAQVTVSLGGTGSSLESALAIPTNLAEIIISHSKLSGFFAYAAPVLMHYSDTGMMPTFDVVAASMDTIANGWKMSVGDVAVLVDYSSAITELRNFNRKLPDLLTVNRAKEIAINKHKSTGQVSDFKTVTDIERRYIEIYDMLREQNLIVNPFVNVQYNFPYIRANHEGWKLNAGSESDYRRFFGTTAFNIVQDVYQPNVSIDKYSYDMTPSVIKAISESLPSFLQGPVPRLYFNSADFIGIVTHDQTAKGEDVARERQTYSAQYSAFYGKNTYYNGRLDITHDNVGSGSFTASAANSPFLFGTNVVRGDFATQWLENTFYRVESYMLLHVPKNNNAALFVRKDDRTGTFSIRAAYRSKTGRFKEFMAWENLDKAKVGTFFEQMEFNNESLGGEMRAKFQSDLPEKKKDFMKMLDTKECAGFMVATNISPHAGVAFFNDMDFGSLPLSTSVRRELVEDPTAGRIYQIPYDSRKTVSSFFDLSQTMGLYAGMFYTKKKGDDIHRPDEITAQFVVDNRLSVAGSVDKIKPGEGSFDSYSFDGKMRAGQYKMQASGVFGKYMPYVPSSFADLNNVPTADVRAGKAAIMQEGVLKRYAFLAILDVLQREGKLNYYGTDAQNDSHPTARSLSGAYEQLFGWVGSVVKGAEEINHMPGYTSGGFGFYLGDESKKIINAHWNLQASGDYQREARFGGFTLSKVSLGGKNSLALGGLAGTWVPSKSRFQYGTVDPDSRDEKKAMAGLGTRVTLGDFVYALQGAYLGDKTSFAGTTGLMYDNKQGFMNAFILSGRKENGNYTNWNVSDLVRFGPGGMFIAYDEERQMATVYSSITLPEIKKSAMAGQLFYVSPTGAWRVRADFVATKMETGNTLESRQRGALSLDYSRIPGEDTPWFVPGLLQSLSFSVEGYKTALNSDVTRFETTNNTHLGFRLTTRWGD